MSARKQTEDRKAEIVRAALALAFEVGPERLTTGMIADRLRLTQPAIYKHFKSKDAIWQGVADRLCRFIADNIQTAKDAATTPQGRLRQLVLGHLAVVRDNPALPQIMVMRDPSEAQIASVARIRTHMSRFRDCLVACLDEAQSRGGIRADIGAEDAATLIFGIIQGLALRILMTRDPDILLREGERLLDLQLSLLAA